MHIMDIENYIFANIEDRYPECEIWDVYNYQGFATVSDTVSRKTLTEIKQLCSALNKHEKFDNENNILECLELVINDISECSCYTTHKGIIISYLCEIEESVHWCSGDSETIEELIDCAEKLANLVSGNIYTDTQEKTQEFKKWLEEEFAEPAPEPEEFNGVVYPSTEALVRAYGVSIDTYLSRVVKGWTKEEALGIVLRIDDDPYLKDRFFEIDDMQPGVRHIFNDNIYCVLGISANSSRANVLSNRDKLEKYHKIGALAAYKSSYDLINVQKPNRELGHLQVVLSSLGALDDRWLWFEHDKYIKFWIAKIVDNLRYESNEYDEILASYYNVLISDPLFVKKSKWDKVLTIIDKWMQKSDQDLYKLIANHVSAEDKNKYNYKMIVSSFKGNILTPLHINIGEGDGDYIVSAFLFWKDNRFSFAKEFEKQCADRAMEMANSQLSSVIFTVKTIPDQNHPSVSSAQEMVSITTAFLDNDYVGLVKLVNVLEGYELYADIIKEKIRKNLWDAGYIIWKSGDNESAARIFSSIYAFCDDEKKSQIKNTFALEKLVEMSEDDFTDDEIIKIADAHDENKNYKDAIRWYRVGAQRKKSQAEYKIGEYYENGYAVEKDLRQAYVWYKKAAENGNISAKRVLALAYYNGNQYCVKNAYLAKQYWISVFIERPFFTDRYLDRYFPNWRTEENDAYDVLKNKNRSSLERLANRGVAAAMYWLGENYYSPDWLLGKINGFSEDEDLARRWFLRAALLGYSPAEDKLDEYYDIDTNEAYTALAMFQCGVKYSKDKSAQGKDLTFFWYRKAVDNGYEDGCNNLGVCYDDATGTERDYEKANELYLRAIKHNENSGAYHNYGFNLFYGYGVKQDKDKSKEYMLKARDKGNESAKKFLKEKFGISDDLSIDFDAIKDTVIYENGGLHIEFCGIRTTEEGFELRFWVNNKAGAQYNIWSKQVKLNGEELEEFSKVDEYADGVCHFATVEFMEKLKGGDTIELSVEIDDEDDDEICTTNRFRIVIDSRTKKPVFNIIGTLISPSLKKDDEDGDPFAFALDDFDDVTVYDKNGVRIDFCGFEVNDDDESLSMQFWIKNSTTAIRKIWIMETSVDGDDVDLMEALGEYKPGEKGYTSISIPQIDIYDEYFIEMVLEVDDKNNKELDEVGKLNVTIDYTEENIEVDVEKETERGSQINSSDALYSPGSYYILNSEHNGIEIYFPSKPKEVIRDALKAGRWRWFQSKGCWYTFNSATNKNLADRITGNNMRR